MISKFRQSLAYTTLLSMAIRVSLVVMFIAILSYFHIVNNLELQTFDKLEQYITERAQKESAIFTLAQDNHEVFKQTFLELWPQRSTTNPDSRFEQLFESRQDGSSLLIEQAFTGMPRPHTSSNDYLGDSKWISGFIGRGAPIADDDFRNRVLLSYDLVDHFALGWSDRFANTYVSLPEGVNIVYWPKLNWAKGADPNLDIPKEEWVYIANKQNNPNRTSVWTGLYYDQTADQWMVSCETPVDDIHGRHLINIGHDILLNNVFKRAFDDHLDGAYNFIVRPDGRLIAHPDHIEELRQSKGILNVDDLSDKTVSEQYKSISKAIDKYGNKPQIIDNDKTNAFIAVSPIEGPNWYFVTIYPKSLLSSPARETAVFIFMLGVISLVLELVMLYLVLIKQVLNPMKRFEMASDLISTRQYNLYPILEDTAQERSDEVGKLAQAMLAMSDHIHEHSHNLEQEIKQRTNELEQAKQLAEMQARTDPLTELPNRRAFYELGTYSFNNAKRYRQPLSVIMLDIDNFKQINDTYGHATGDSVLKAMGSNLIDLLRPSDLCGRIGGEEFAIVASTTDINGAAKLAEKIRLHLKTVTVFVDDKMLNFTVSLGVAEIADKHYKFEALLEDADIALYEAKGAGRDQVVVSKVNTTDYIV